MVDSVMVPSKLSNCEADVDNFLCSLEHVKEAVSPVVSTAAQTPSITDSICWSVKSILSVCKLPGEDEYAQGLSVQENNILAYIGGYIVRKIKGKVCNTCSNKIVGQVEPDNPNHEFIAAKSYGKLQSPSKLLLGTVQLLELKYRKVIASLIHQKCIKAKLICELSKLENLQKLKCELSHLDILVLHLVNIRLHHTIKEINQNLRDNKDRKNRKTLKFSHL